MKTILIITYCSGLLLFAECVVAQTQLKIGHIDVNKTLTSMPEYDSAQIQLERDANEFSTMLDNLQVAYNKLVDDYNTNKNNYSDLVLESKESAIIQAEENITGFQQNASQQLQQKNIELLQPIYDKIQNAMDKVATEGEFTYILDISQGAVVFVSPNSQDIGQLVLSELGIDN